MATAIGFVLAHAGGRFIQQQQPRLQRQGGGDLRRALVAVGEFADQPVRLAGQAGLRQRLIDAAVDLGGVPATEPEALSGGPWALSTPMRMFSRTVSSGKISVIWKVRAIPMATRSVTAILVTGGAVEHDLAGGGREEAGDHVEERRLAGAVGADDGAKFPRRHLHRHVADGDQAAELLRDVANIQHDHFAVPSLQHAKDAAGEKQNDQDENQADERHPVDGHGGDVVLQHDEQRGADQRAPEGAHATHDRHDHDLP